VAIRTKLEPSGREAAGPRFTFSFWNIAIGTAPTGVGDSGSRTSYTVSPCRVDMYMNGRFGSKEAEMAPASGTFVMNSTFEISGGTSPVAGAAGTEEGASGALIPLADNTAENNQARIPRAPIPPPS
jgi:hypothetical protein